MEDKWRPVFRLLKYFLGCGSDAPHLQANVALMVGKRHKYEHVALSAAGQTGADAGPGPNVGLVERA